MKYVYPALFVWDNQEKVYNTEVTDLPGCFAFGETIDIAIAATRDAICEWLINSEDKNEAIPQASPLPATQTTENSFYTLVDADTLEYRKVNGSQAVKKTLSIPSWLNERAEKANAPYSQILQEGLKEYLHIK